MLLNLGIGLVTPPVGTTLFVGSAIGKVPIEESGQESLAVLVSDAGRPARGYLCAGVGAVGAELALRLAPLLRAGTSSRSAGHLRQCRCHEVASFPLLPEEGVQHFAPCA